MNAPPDKREFAHRWGSAPPMPPSDRIREETRKRRAAERGQRNLEMVCEKLLRALPEPVQAKLIEAGIHDAVRCSDDVQLGGLIERVGAALKADVA